MAGGRIKVALRIAPDLNERAQSRWLSGCWQDALKTAERNVEERFKGAGAIKMALDLPKIDPKIDPKIPRSTLRSTPRSTLRSPPATFLPRSCHAPATFLPRYCSVLVTLLPRSCLSLVMLLPRSCHVHASQEQRIRPQQFGARGQQQ